MMFNYPYSGDPFHNNYHRYSSNYNRNNYWHNQQDNNINLENQAISRACCYFGK